MGQAQRNLLESTRRTFGRGRDRGRRFSRARTQVRWQRGCMGRQRPRRSNGSCISQRRGSHRTHCRLAKLDRAQIGRHHSGVGQQHQRQKQPARFRPVSTRGDLHPQLRLQHRVHLQLLRPWRHIIRTKRHRPHQCRRLHRHRHQYEWHEKHQPKLHDSKNHAHAHLPEPDKFGAIRHAIEQQSGRFGRPIRMEPRHLRRHFGNQSLFTRDRSNPACRHPLAQRHLPANRLDQLQPSGGHRRRHPHGDQDNQRVREHHAADPDEFDLQWIRQNTCCLR